MMVERNMQLTISDRINIVNHQKRHRYYRNEERVM